MSDMSLLKLFALRKLVSPYHPLTVTKDLSVFAALTSPIAGIDDMRWYFMQLFNLNRFIELISPLEEYMNNFNALEASDNYQMPVLLISGSCDWICPVDFVKTYASSLSAPKVKLELLEGCGHSPQIQLPEEFSSMIRDFLIK
jgi:pimeloyl-ACP methyl ester carboxylesterase